MDQYTFAKGTPRSLFVVKRGPRPSHYHPSLLHHAVIVCSRKHTTKWEAGWTGDGAWVWEKYDAPHESGGWLLVRWNGLDIDYGHIVRGVTLPDGTQGAFRHKQRDLGYTKTIWECGPHEKPKWLGYSPEVQEPWSLLAGAVWWSDHVIPKWLSEAGVLLAPDEFSVTRIERDDGTCYLPQAQQEKLEARRYQERGPKP